MHVDFHEKRPRCSPCWEPSGSELPYVRCALWSLVQRQGPADGEAQVLSPCIPSIFPNLRVRQGHCEFIKKNSESRTSLPNSVGLEYSLEICIFNAHPGGFGCWWFIEPCPRNCRVVHQIFQRKSPQTQTSGVLTGKWLQLTNANIWLVQLFLYHYYLWMVLDEEINDIKWWIISKSF